MTEETDIAAYARDGVVYLRSSFDATWIARLPAAMERDLAHPGANATNLAKGSSAGKFFGDTFM